MVTGSALAPISARLSGYHAPRRALSVHTVNPYVTYAPVYTGRFAGYHYPQPVAARVIGTAGNAALSRSAASVDPYVTYAPAFTGRFAGRRYPRRAMPIPRRGRLGQSFLSDLGSLFTPNPGGGSGIDASGQPTYVNSAGVDQSTPDTSAGASLNPFSSSFDPGAVVGEDVQANLSSLTGGLIPNPQSTAGLPSWVYWAGGIAVIGGIGYFALRKKRKGAAS